MPSPAHTADACAHLITVGGGERPEVGDQACADEHVSCQVAIPV